MSHRIRFAWSSLLVALLTLAVAGVASAGYTNGNDPHGTPQHHPKQNHCGCSHVQGSSNHSSPATTQATTPTQAPANASPGMPTWYVSPMLISLSLNDTPLPFKPSVGPAMGFTLAYNQMDVDQPTTFAWSNVGPKWTFNWLSYIQDDPNHPGQKVLTYMSRGPGRPEHQFNTGNGTFAPEVESGARLIEVSTDPVVYERRFPDGSKDVYAESDDATSYPRHVFLSKRVGVHGNALTLHYDSEHRLLSVDNPEGDKLVFHYADTNHSLRLTSVSDNAGRTASLQYDTAGRLTGITDVMGMNSTFAYASDGTSITAMTTLYGTTHFDTHRSGVRRYIDITDAGGHKERWEFNEAVSGIPFSVSDVPVGINAFNRYLNSRDSFFWDATTLKRFGAVYSKALNYHWNHKRNATSTTSDTLESIKYPLESRIWYNHPGDRAGVSGSLNVPSVVARVLPDGSTQGRSNSYDAQGRLTRSIAPNGLETDYTYAANGIDVVKIERKGSDGSDSVETFTYDNQHDVLSHSDETGSVTHFTYNPHGELLTRTDALGQVTRYAYDAAGNRITSTDAEGHVTHFAYDALGRVTSQTDPLGRTTHYQYDALNRLTRTTYADGTYTATTWNKLDKASVRDRDGHVTRYTHDAMRHRTSATDALGHTTHRAYYSNGLLKSRTDADGHTTTYQRDIEGRITAVINAHGDSTAFSYDSADRRTKVTNALGQVATVSYNKMNRPVRITNANGVDTDSTWTARGWLASMSVHADGASGAVTQLAYDAHGNRTGITDADGVTTTFAYDADHRLDAITDALGNTQVFTRDADGRVTAVAKAAGGSSQLAYLHRFAYDAAGERIASIDADGHTIHYHYDKAGHLSEKIDPLGVRTKTRFDAAGHLLESVQGEHGHHRGPWHPPFGAGSKSIAHIGYRYDDDGRLIAVTDPDGLTTRYTYDADGHKVQQDSPDTGITSYAFDAVGNRIGQTDARGIHSQRQYDALQRLVAIHYPADSSVDVHDAYGEGASITGCAHSYPIGHLTSMTDPSGSTHYCYDARGNIIAEQRVIGGRNYAIAYRWTRANRLAGITYPSGVKVAYQRNAAGRVTVITEQGPHDATPVTVVSAIDRLPFGPIARMAYGNGKLAITRAYDGNYRGTSVKGLGLDLAVHRDADGDITRLRTRAQSYLPTERYRYDSLKRLTAVTGPWGFLKQRYSYNATGDRTSKITARDGLVRYGYQPGSHRLAVIHHGLGWPWGGWNPFCGWGAQHACRRGGPVLSDANGNIIQMPRAGGTLSLDYGVNNRLRKVTNSQGISATYRYDGHGRRAEKIAPAPGQTRDFVYQGTRLLAEYTAGSSDQREYLWLGRHLIASLDTTPTATSVHYIATDFLGSPRRVTTTKGDAVWSWRYAGNPFGDQPPQGSYTLNLRFPGQYHDGLSGSNYNIHRDYSPVQGRYVESDPLGLAAGMSTYAYVGGSPLWATDPLAWMSTGEWIDHQAMQEALSGNHVRTYLYAFAGEAWKFFGAEGLSQVVDKGWSCSTTGDKIGAVLSVAAVLPIGKAARWYRDLRDVKATEAVARLRRPYLRKATREAIQNAAAKTPDGKFVDPNTGEIIEGKFHYGHKYGHEFRRLRSESEAKGITQKEFNDYVNGHPEFFQIEDPSANMSHRYEMPGGG